MSGLAVSNRLQLIITAGQRVLRPAGVRRGSVEADMHENMDSEDEEILHNKVSGKEAGTQLQNAEQSGEESQGSG